MSFLFKKKKKKPDMVVVHICNHRTWDTEAGRYRVQG